MKYLKFGNFWLAYKTREYLLQGDLKIKCVPYLERLKTAIFFCARKLEQSVLLLYEARLR